MLPGGDVATLDAWLSSLEALSRCALDPELSVADRAWIVAKRQEAFTEIQSLDREIRRYAAARRAGWPGLDAEEAARAEALFSKGLVTLAEIIRRDSKMLETMEGIRRCILSRLKEGTTGRALVSRMRGGGQRRALIVDDHF